MKYPISYIVLIYNNKVSVNCESKKISLYSLFFFVKYDRFSFIINECCVVI